jgi:hypothetical protein
MASIDETVVIPAGDRIDGRPGILLAQKGDHRAPLCQDE